MFTQRTAPQRPMNKRTGVKISGFTIPFPIVFATAVENTNGPAKQQIDAMIIALRGDSACVATTVAIVFAASFLPFEKLNARAIRTPAITNIVEITSIIMSDG
jgi:hypothetical protein